MSRALFLAVLCGLAATLAAGALREGVPPLAVAAALLAAAAAVAYHWRHAVGSHRPAAGTPVAPGALPLLGNALQVLPNVHRIHDWILEQQRGVGRGGVTFAFSVPFLRTFYCVADPGVLEWALKGNFANYVKGAPFRDNFGDLLGRGIFVSDGEEWRWQRKLATRIFSVRSFKLYVAEVFNAKADLLLSRLAAACPPPAAAEAAAAAGGGGGGGAPRFAGVEPGAPLDLHDLMYRFTLDTFARIGFGTDPGCLTAEGRIPFAVAFDRAQRTTNARFWVPCWRLLEMLDGRGAQLRRDIATVRSFASGIIATRRTMLTDAGAPEGKTTAAEGGCGKGAEGGKAAAPEGKAAAAEGGKGASGKEAEGAAPPSPAASSASSCDSFAPARGGSAAAAAAPTKGGAAGAAGAAARGGGGGGEGEGCEGPSDLLGLFMSEDGPDGSPLAEETLIDTVLNFIIAARAVFLEGLRLHPSVPENAKFAVRPDTLPDGTRVPVGAMLHYSAFAINRRLEFWGDDADEFRPERWAEFVHAPSPYSCQSFHAGPRVCLGQRLAELEGVYVLVLLLRRFRFTPVPGRAVAYELSASMPMRDGLWVTVEERAAAA
ncbi:MAG: cytochrome P450 [Monoraphidium minutum]|nr:MAG: cytochrome P450 [Monoraphidium minutum]